METPNICINNETTHLRHAQPSAIHLLNERFSQKCHVNISRIWTVGIRVSIDEALVGGMGLAPALVFSSVGRNEWIFASTAGIVARKAPVRNLPDLEVVLTVDVGPIMRDDAHLNSRIEEVH